MWLVELLGNLECLNLPANWEVNIALSITAQLAEFYESRHYWVLLGPLCWIAPFVGFSAYSRLYQVQKA